MDADFANRAYLISKGIPFDVAWSLTPPEVTAYCVTFATQDGNEFDWQTMQFRKKDP